MFNDYYQTRHRSPPGASRKTEIQVKGRRNIWCLNLFERCLTIWLVWFYGTDSWQFRSNGAKKLQTL